MGGRINLQSRDFSDLASFELAWRWLPETRARFSDSELQKIQPLLPEVAKRVYRELEQAVLSRFDMSGQNFFSCGACSLDVVALDREAVSSWINKQLPEHEDNVIISWISFGQDVAVMVQRNLFIRRWDDFCYPLSDDIDIWAPSLSFVLRYSYNEIFSFKANGKNLRRTAHGKK